MDKDTLIMPTIYIRGRIGQKPRVVQYIRNLTEELGIHRMWSKEIFIRFRTNLDGNSEGLCWGDKKDGYVEIEIARRLSNRSLPMYRVMHTLAHEMVHAKQYLRGELDGYTNSWKGRKPRNYKYENAPWEKEAYKLEAELYKKCWPK